jgi:hypothetical protein
VEVSVKALLATGRLDAARVKQALRAQAREGGSVLRHLRDAGEFTDETMCEILASATGLPFARPADLAAATPDALRTVPAEACRDLRALPLRLDWWGALVVAMADPFDEAARAELEFATGRSLRVELCTEDAVLAAISLHHRPVSEDDPSFLYDDDLSDLFAAACADEADILEVADEDLVVVGDEPPARGN